MPVSFWTPWSLRLGGLAAQAAMRPPFGPMLHPSEWRIRALGLSTAVGHPVFHLVWTYWLQSSWMKWRRWRSWKIRNDVVPLSGHLIFSQSELMLLD